MKVLLLTVKRLLSGICLVILFGGSRLKEDNTIQGYKVCELPQKLKSRNMARKNSILVRYIVDLDENGK